MRVLLVDDDDQFLAAIKTVLELEKCEVETATNGKSAAELATVKDFDLVISDIRMKGMTGIALLHHLKKVSKVPVVLMTGFSEIKEVKEAHEMGASDFIAKPFKKEDLVRVVRKHDKEYSESGSGSGSSGSSSRKSGSAPSKDEDDDSYCGISIDHFVSGSDIKYDIFVKLNQDKFVKVANSGENISIDRVRTYREKGVSHLYLTKEDFKSYVGFTVNLAKAASVSNLDKSKKIHLMQHTTNVIMEQLFLSGVDEKLFHSSKEVVDASVNILKDQDDARMLLESLNSSGDHLFAHSVGVSMYAAMIAKKIGWHSYSTQVKLSMGGLFHDIGKKEIPKHIVEKARVLMTQEEISIYESHTSKGVEILSKMRGMSSDVIQIVAQHHENCLGHGFPNRMDKNSIHPLAKIVGLANVFCELVITNPECKGFPPLEAIERIRTSRKGQFEEASIAALESVFSKPPL